MNEHKRQVPFVNVGSSLLLVVFLLMCLITFATLSFTSARSDESFSRRIAARKTEYYTASNQAERLLWQLDNLLAAADPKDLDFAAIDSIDADITYRAEENTLSYQIPINDKQALEVVLALEEKKAGSGASHYQIKKWQTVNTKKWESDDTLKLMPIP